MNDFVNKIKSDSDITLEDFTRDGYKTVIVRLPRTIKGSVREIGEESGYALVDEYETGREVICQFEQGADQ